MKLLKPNEYVYTAIQFTLPIAVLLGIGAEWHWWALSFIMFLLYTVVGNNLALHRYYSHNEFSIGPISKFIFAWYWFRISCKCASSNTLDCSLIAILSSFLPVFTPLK